MAESELSKRSDNMKFARAILLLCLGALASCSTVQNPGYQSNAPEIRGERAVASNIELIGELELDMSVLGVFLSKEVFQGGDSQTLLFTCRALASSISQAQQGSVIDYDLSETASLSVDQAHRFLSAIDSFIATDPKSLTPAQMLNFELYSGTLNMSEGNEKYRPFKDVTFMVICSVTSVKKSFRTVFPEVSYDIRSRRTIEYSSFDLTEDQVKKLRDAISAVLDKSTPTVKPASDGNAPA
jgi:hypothetical protein